MSPPRAWEFLIGGCLAIEGFPVLRSALAQQIARGLALVLIAIPIFALRQGPGFPGIQRAVAVHRRGHVHLERHRRADANARAGIRRSTSSGSSVRFPIRCICGTGRCSPSRGFPRTSLVLDPLDKVALFALTVAISYLSWRYVEQPFRRGVAGADASRRVPHRRSRDGWRCSSRSAARIRRQPDAVGCRPRRAATGFLQRLRLSPLSRSGSCFTRLAGEPFGDACLALATGQNQPAAVGRQPGRALFPWP